MRRGIADLHRRAEVSRKAAERYLDAFASLAEDTRREELIRRFSRPA
jgi:quinol monooxygenase YgiN